MRPAVLALALFLAALPAAAGGSGLRGLVTKGPITPVCRIDRPCDAPAAHVRLTFSRGGVTRGVVTGDDGRYRIALAPGAYRVRIPSARFGFRPATAIVPAGRYAVRNFAIDTGIR